MSRVFLASRNAKKLAEMQRILAAHVPGVEVVAVEGEDMRRGELARVVRPAGPDARLDALAALPPQGFEHVTRGLRARTESRDGERWRWNEGHAVHLPPVVRGLVAVSPSYSSAAMPVRGQKWLTATPVSGSPVVRRPTPFLQA